MAFFLEVGDVPIHARNVLCNESLGAMVGRLVTDPQPPTDKPHDTQGKELKLTPPHRQEALQVNQNARSEDISFWQVSTRASFHIRPSVPLVGATRLPGDGTCPTVLRGRLLTLTRRSPARKTSGLCWRCRWAAGRADLRSSGSFPCEPDREQYRKQRIQ